MGNWKLHFLNFQSLSLCTQIKERLTMGFIKKYWKLLQSWPFKFSLSPEKQATGKQQYRLSRCHMPGDIVAVLSQLGPMTAQAKGMALVASHDARFPLSSLSSHSRTRKPHTTWVSNQKERMHECTPSARSKLGSMAWCPSCEAAQ